MLFRSEVMDETTKGYYESSSEAEGNKVIFTNTHTPEVTNLVINKAWSDKDNQDGIRPDKITVEINGSDGFTKTVELTANGEWKATLDNLPTYVNKTKVTYSVKEVKVDGYTTAIAEPVIIGNTITFNITNTHTPTTTELSVNKIWNDNNDQDGLRTDIEVQLVSRDNENRETVIETVTLTADKNWSHTFTNLLKHKDGVLVNYDVKEITEIPGYTSNKTGDMNNGFVITNTHTPEKTKLVISKVWDDNND